MKALLPIALFVILCFNGAKGQTLPTKARNYQLSKVLNPENIHYFSGMGEKFKMHSPNLFKTPIGNQFKSAWEGTQKPDSAIFETWDSTANQLIVSGKTVFTYDANGMESSEIGYGWTDFNNYWEAYNKTEYTYDANGNRMLDVQSIWNRTASKWEINGKEGYTYDENRNVTSDSTYLWDEINSLGLNQNKINYIYSGTDLISYNAYMWDADYNRWVNTFKDEYTYDDDGLNLTLEIVYSWDGSTNQWVNFNKYEYSYVDYTIENYYWDENASEWVKNGKDEYTYDAFANMTLLVEYYWDETNSQYEYLYKINNNYDVNRNLISSIDYYWNETTSQWDEFSKETYYYPDLNPTLIPGVSARPIHVYPNPAREYIVFDLTDISSYAMVELLDLHGKKVMEQKLNGDKKVTISNMPKGMYFYRLYDKGNVYKGKITVE